MINEKFLDFRPEEVLFVGTSVEFVGVSVEFVGVSVEFVGVSVEFVGVSVEFFGVSIVLLFLSGSKSVSFCFWVQLKNYEIVRIIIFHLRSWVFKSNCIVHSNHFLRL